MKTCPKCMKQIENDCKVCPYCNMEFVAHEETAAEKQLKRNAEKNKNRKEAGSCLGELLKLILTPVAVIAGIFAALWVLGLLIGLVSGGF